MMTREPSSREDDELVGGTVGEGNQDVPVLVWMIQMTIQPELCIGKDVVLLIQNLEGVSICEK